ncbi:AEC family transporter [Paracraurococcus lichenis]|uniref:AEC family transporter n=1 Tax=Paracraurococcus lichenis TaxID=3064888 RepID=A0ABT9E2C8_9PROT|nr:AEC family transporter [Paracraurococcus sp. LOR1-02]MDO9710321.1 AEC family transporter [Paracraurococcus sp. LOR1-02]
MTLYLDVFVPPFGLLLLGALLRRFLLREDAVWAGIEKLVFWALMPALLCSAIGAVDLRTLPIGDMATAIWLALLGGGALSLLLAQAARIDHPARTSVFQGGIRFNNLMGFAITGGLFGAAGTSLGAVATGLIVPFVQTLTSLVFALGGGRGFAAGRAFRQLALNPLLLACLAGFAVSLAGGLPAGIAPMLRSLGQASVALGLLCVGAALSPGALRGRLPLQLATCGIKLVLVPLMVLGIGRALGLEPLALAVALVFMALPTATTSYVMARAMGGDAPLMAALTTLEHLLSVVSLPLWILLLGP